MPLTAAPLTPAPVERFERALALRDELPDFVDPWIRVAYNVSLAEAREDLEALIRASGPVTTAEWSYSLGAGGRLDRWPCWHMTL